MNQSSALRFISRTVAASRFEGAAPPENKPRQHFSFDLKKEKRAGL